MPAIQDDFEIEQGASFGRAYVLRDSAGDPVDLTGVTARMQIRQSVASPDVLLELTTENGMLVIDPLNGRTDISLDADTTAAMTWRRGVFDLELVDGTGWVTRLVRGTITVIREVTRNAP